MVKAKLIEDGKFWLDIESWIYIWEKGKAFGEVEILCLKVYRPWFIRSWKHQSLVRTENLQIRPVRGKPANVSEGPVVSSVECSVWRPHHGGGGELLKVLRYMWSHWHFSKDYWLSCQRWSSDPSINKKQDFSCQEKNVGSYILLEDKINLLLFSTHYLTPTVFQYQINLWCSYLFTSIVLPSSPCPYFQKTWLGFHESIVLITFLYPLWPLLPWIPFS